MHKQIAGRHVLTCHSIIEFERRKILADRRVPAQLAFIDQHRQRRRGKGFGAGANSKNSPGRDLRVSRQIALAKATGEDEFAVFDSRQRQRK